MRQTGRWNVVFGGATLLLSLAFTASIRQAVQAVTTISQIGSDIDGEAAADASGVSVAMSADGTRIAIGASNNDSGGNNEAGHVRVYTLTNGAWIQTGADIDGNVANGRFGVSVAMSSDGTRIAVGAHAPTVASDPGRVRVFTWNGSAWTQTGSDIVGEAAADWFGQRVAMSSDGTRIAVGARQNDGNGTNAGHVRIYTLTGNTWAQTGSDIDGEATGDFSGASVALSSDGTRVAVGAIANGGNGTNAGHVRIYTLTGNAWTQTGPDIDAEAAGDNFGWAVALSSDGTRIAIGAGGNDANGTNAGHVRIYTLTGNAWTQTGSDIDGEAAGDFSGQSIAMSTEGTRIAIGATQNDGSGTNAGHVRIYTLTGNAWTQTGSDIDGEAADDNFGGSIAISTDGTRIAIGASANDGNGSNAGHVRVYGGLDSTATTTTTTTTTTTIATTTSTAAATATSTTTAAATTTVAATTTTTLSPTVTQPSPAVVRALAVKEIVSSDNVAAGSSVKLTAGGFTPSESVLVGVLGSPDTPSQVTADSRGAIATKVSIPTDASGKVTVYAYGQTSKRGFRQVVTVEAAKTLPATGSNSSLLTLFGVALLATGVLFTARRRFTR